MTALALPGRYSVPAPCERKNGKDRAKSVDVLGEQIAVKARIYTLGGFSAHADQRELLEWVSSFKNAPRVFVVHGEEKTSQVFSEIVSNRLGFTVSVPAKGQTFEL